MRSAWGCWIWHKEKQIKPEMIKAKQEEIRSQRWSVPHNVYNLGS